MLDKETEFSSQNKIINKNIICSTASNDRVTSISIFNYRNIGGVSIILASVIIVLAVEFACSSKFRYT